MTAITVFTATLPERHVMLAECMAAVRAQTLQPLEHLIMVDHSRVGPAEVCNRLLGATSGDWVALIADDDLMYPQHLETLAAHADDADIIYSWCRVTGRDWNPNRSFDAEALRNGNYIPATSLIRSDLVRHLQGWRADAAHGFEDWDFWLRALDVGARFHCVERITWEYRFWGGNISWPSAPPSPPADQVPASAP